MLYQYLTENYRLGEPIFSADITLPVSATNLRQMFKKLCDSGAIVRCEPGVYVLPAPSRLKGSAPLPPAAIVESRYVARRGRVEGYYTGCTFANQIGITTQVPFVTEIVSNNASAAVREVTVGGTRVLLRRPRAAVDAKNCRILQFLDLLNGIDQYADEEPAAAPQKLRAYVKRAQLTKAQIDRYISLYPDKIYKHFYEMRLYDVLA
ncbi:MAG: hypothetical protein J5974_03935 [Pyramidobacter sp.]|nr:hypothetical protein [Pyramidobacter sp.]